MKPAELHYFIDPNRCNWGGRLPVVDRDDPRRLVGIITRSDALSAYRQQLHETERSRPTVSLR